MLEDYLGLLSSYFTKYQILVFLEIGILINKHNGIITFLR